MSNIIPPLLSSTPPPIVDNFDDDEDDEFGDYRTAGDTAFACDSPSIPPTPEFTLKKNLVPSLDINSNNSKDLPVSKSDEIIIVENEEIKIGSKDFQDRRKSSDCSHEEFTEFSSSSTEDTSSKTLNSFDQVGRKTNLEIVSSNPETEKSEEKVDSDVGLVQGRNIINGCEIVIESNGHFTASERNSEHNDGQIMSNSFSQNKYSENDYNSQIDFTEFSSCINVSGPLENVSVVQENIHAIDKVKPHEIDITKNIQNSDSNKLENPAVNDQDETLDNFQDSTSGEPKIFVVSSESQLLNQDSILPSSIDCSVSFKDISLENTETKIDLQASDLIQTNLENKSPTLYFERETEHIAKGNDDDFDDFVACTEKERDTYFEKPSFDFNLLRQTHISSKSEEDSSKENHCTFENYDGKNDYEFDEFISNNELTTRTESYTTVSAKDESDAVEDHAAETKTPENGSQESEDEFNEFIAANSPIAYPDISDITSFSFDNSKASKLENVEQESISNPLETFAKVDDDEFGDFKACVDESLQIETKNDQDDFDDFADFTSSSAANNEDDFDDFGDFTSQAAGCSNTQEEGPMLDLNSKNVPQKAEEIIKIMFEPISCPAEEICVNDYCVNNPVFSYLREITETKALSYQWAKSSSQKSLLKALNIDESDILYGPSLNLSLPRFAANLSIAPLEPIKSEISCSNIQGINAPSPNPCNSADVPTAQFDWSSSGLTNPLDYSQTMLLDLEHLVQTLDISGSLNVSDSNKSASPIDELEEWDLWLKSKAAKEKAENPSKNQESINQKPTPGLPQTTECLTPSLSSLVLQPEVVSFVGNKSSTFSDTNTPQFPDLMSGNQHVAISDDFEFTDLQSPEQSWSSVVPLRETHISEAEKVNTEPDLVGWLQPTILTPVIPRKDLTHTLEDDDFDDFQMVLPSEEVKEVPNRPHKNKNQMNAEKLKNDPLFGEFECSKTEKDVKAADFSDDEFTDFHSSLPVTAVKLDSQVPSQNQGQTVHPTPKVTEPVIQTFSQPIQPVTLEPLKPVTVYQNSPARPAQINWPNPGITDEDLYSIDLTYSVKPSNVSQDDDKHRSPAKTKEVKKDHSLDDDDWTDFVSVQEPSINKQLTSHTNKPERTATPDLPLSVLNLGHVQPVKQPIPVITPKGLIQTQLPSSLPPLKVVQTSIYGNHMNNMQHINVQPSLITNQFIGQAYQKNSAGFTSGGETSVKHLPNTNLPVNSGNKCHHFSTSAKQGIDEDDYWSDFVSSKPVNHSSQQKVAPSSSKSFQHLNGLFQNNTPNIITNPVHFDAFQSYVPPGDVAKSNRVANIHSRKSALSTASTVPELDFVAPKSRTSHRK